MLTNEELITIVESLDTYTNQLHMQRFCYDDLREELTRISLKIEDILINRGVEVNSICDS